MSDSVLTDGVPSIPEFRPVDSNVFTRRAERFSILARGHALCEYLNFAAALSRAQALELEQFPQASVPDDVQIEQCRQHGLPPLSVDNALNGEWQDGLHRILSTLNIDALPPQAAAVTKALRDSRKDTLERDATKVLAGAYSEVEAGRLPFIGAALQVHWVKMALALGSGARGSVTEYGLCPVCGSLPVASVVRSGGAAQGLRYLVCSLCASEWHVVRIKCTACASTENVSLLFIEDSNDAVRAECCDDCNTYLKIFYLDRDNRLDSSADDLATLALDMLVDDEGYQRIGPNLLFSPAGER